jgi:hypothetical protein
MRVAAGQSRGLVGKGATFRYGKFDADSGTVFLFRSVFWALHGRADAGWGREMVRQEQRERFVFSVTYV